MKTLNDKTFQEKESIELAIGSFVISTFLLLLFIISNESPTVFVIAWPFALGGIVLNAIMFIHLMDRFIRLPMQRREIGIKILILLSNIPVVFFYYLIVMKS